MVAAPFVVGAIGLFVGDSLMHSADPSIQNVGRELSFNMNYVIPLVWLASIVVGIVAVILPLGRWRLAGLLAIVAPALEAIAALALLVYGFSTI